MLLRTAYVVEIVCCTILYIVAYVNDVDHYYCELLSLFWKVQSCEKEQSVAEKDFPLPIFMQVWRSGTGENPLTAPSFTRFG